MAPALGAFCFKSLFLHRRLGFRFYVVKNGCCHVLRPIAGRAIESVCLISLLAAVGVVRILGYGVLAADYKVLALANVLFFKGWLKARVGSISSFFTTTPQADVFCLRRLI
jgi:hypothetical protein